MFLDLNVPWRANDPDLKKTIALLVDFGYDAIALTHTISGPIQPTHKSPIPLNPFPEHSKLRILTRAHYILASPSQLPHLSILRQHYDLLSVSPTTLPLLKTICTTPSSPEWPQIDLVSLPLHTRLPFLLKPTYLAAALRHGIRFEVNYGPAILDVDARRNTISNAGMIARCMRDGSTRGGVVISSGTLRSGGVRAPYDVINLAVFWGMNQDIGRQGVDKEAKKVFSACELRRRRAAGEVIDEDEEKRREKEEEKMDVEQGIEGDIVIEDEDDIGEENGMKQGQKRKAEGEVEDEDRDGRIKIGKKVESEPRKYSHRKHQQRAYKKQKQFERQREKKARKKEQLGKGPTLPKQKKQAAITS